jgi:hypothetical protein
MPQKIVQVYYHPAGDFTFSHRPPFSLCELCDEIELRDLGSIGLVYFRVFRGQSFRIVPVWESQLCESISDEYNLPP